MRVVLGLSYDGSGFRGWQTQPGGQTVQDTLEAALESFVDHPVQTVCAGRTDAGVHALNQIIHLDTTANRTPESWVRGVNALLPSTIAVQWTRHVPDDFHARFSAQGREYVYIVRNHRVRAPLLAGRVGWVYRPLDVDAMRQAARSLLGEHDFSCFRSAECQAASPIRRLNAVDISKSPPFIYFRFHANAFLHHMIRNMMGTLLYIGMGRQAPGWVGDLLAGRDRRFAAPTFAADGLYLAGVDYPKHYDLPLTSAASCLQVLTGISPTLADH